MTASAKVQKRTMIVHYTDCPHCGYQIDDLEHGLPSLESKIDGTTIPPIITCPDCKNNIELIWD